MNFRKRYFFYKFFSDYKFYNCEIRFDRINLIPSIELYYEYRHWYGLIFRFLFIEIKVAKEDLPF
jgi:hypothetical protein